MSCYKEEEDYDYYDEDEEDYDEEEEDGCEEKFEDGDLNEEGVPMVKLVGTDGNVFSLMAKVSRAMKRSGLKDKVDDMVKDATSGDYNHALQVFMKYCDIR